MASAMIGSESPTRTVAAPADRAWRPDGRVMTANRIANGIAIALQGVTPPRPLTHDLFLNVLGDLRASLKRIVVTDLRDDIFYAQLHLEAGGTPRTIDARPSDAIALALRARVPILVEDRVFEKAERIPPKGGSAPTL